MNTNLVSVVIPCFNNSLTIHDTLCSVLNQTYSYWEVICVDDGSSDNTWEIICKESQDNPQIRGIRRTCKEKGGSVCRNIGIKYSKGEYIIFLDADDLLAPDCIEKRVSDIKKNNCYFCVWPYAYLKDNVPGNNSIDYRIKNYLYGFAAGHASWQTTCPIYCTQYVRNIGGFDGSFQRLQDIEFGLRAVFYSGGNYSVKRKEVPPDCFYRPNTNKTRTSKYILALNHYDKLASLVTNLEKNGLKLSNIKKNLLYTCLLLTAYQVFIMCKDDKIDFKTVFQTFDIKANIGFFGKMVFFLVCNVLKSKNAKVYLCRYIKRIILYCL